MLQCFRMMFYPIKMLVIFNITTFHRVRKHSSILEYYQTLPTSVLYITKGNRIPFNKKRIKLFHSFTFKKFAIILSHRKHFIEFSENFDIHFVNYMFQVSPYLKSSVRRL